jgi:hypothetical protein
LFHGVLENDFGASLGGFFEECKRSLMSMHAAAGVAQAGQESIRKLGACAAARKLECAAGSGRLRNPAALDHTPRNVVYGLDGENASHEKTR